MTSWRSTTPQPVQDDFDALLTLALDRAEELLKEHREFFPFGITMSDEGPEGLASADPGTGEQPESQLVLDLLYEGAAASRSEYRAVAFVADVQVDGSDAVRIETVHRDGGPALVITMPYQFTGFRKKTCAYGQMTLGPGERRVWTG